MQKNFLLCMLFLFKFITINMNFNILKKWSLFLKCFIHPSGQLKSCSLWAQFLRIFQLNMTLSFSDSYSPVYVSHGTYHIGHVLQSCLLMNLILPLSYTDICGTDYVIRHCLNQGYWLFPHHLISKSF